MAGKIVGERGGVNNNEGALIHTYVQYEDGSEVTVSSSYHETIPEGNSTFVFKGRDPYVGLLIEGPIREYHTPAHGETLALALAASSIAELEAGLKPSDEAAPAPEFTEIDPTDFDSMLNELLSVLGIDPSELEGAVED